MSPRIRLTAPGGRIRWVRVLPDAAAVAQRAADLVEESVRAEPESPMILPAGGTPVPMYRELQRRASESGLDLSLAPMFQLDEVEDVGPDDPRSFHDFLRRSLLDRVERRRDRDHLLDGRAEDPVAEIERHGTRLSQLGGACLCVLGLGVNGHIGYNEPGSNARDGARRVELDASTLEGLRPHFLERPVPTHGLTLGVREILAARRVCVLVTGASKADILMRSLTCEPGPELPASWVADHPDVSWLVDEAAARRIAQATSTAG